MLLHSSVSAVELVIFALGGFSITGLLYYIDYYLNNGGVSCENRLGVDDAVFFGCGINIPEADCVVIRCA